MSLWDHLKNAKGALDSMKSARAALDLAEDARREKTRNALNKAMRHSALNWAQGPLDLGGLPKLVEQHLHEVLVASSQANGVREIAHAFGVYDLLRGLIDKLEGKKG